MSVVVGISGISGSGKSTLASALADSSKSTLIHWDDFDEISSSPDNYVEWHRSGRPEGRAAWKYPKLAECLSSLKSRNPVKHPVTGKTLETTPWVVFDAPMGRDHQETGKYIDFWVHIDCPLDVAMARRLLRDFDASSSSDILQEIRFYLEQSRLLFKDSLSCQPDMVVDATQSVDALVNNVSSAVSAHLAEDNPRIEKAAAADKVEIKDIMERDWGGEPLVVRTLKYYPSEMTGLVSRKNGSLGGFLFYDIRDRELEIIVFEVFDKFKGLGSLFLNKVKEIAAQQGVSRIFLMTTNDNLDALRFYQKRGFQLCKLHVDSVKESRKLKPSIGEFGDYGIPVRDEIDLELLL